MLRRYSWYVLVALLSFALVGCGGDNKPKETSSANQTQQTQQSAPAVTASNKPFKELTKEDRMSVEHLKEFKSSIENDNKLSQIHKEAMALTIEPHIKADDKPTMGQVTKEFGQKVRELKQKREQEAQQRGYTREQFSKIQNNMTYQQVVDILGTGGELFMETGDMKNYRWANRDGSNMVIMFNRGRVMSKTQAGLK